MCVRVSRGVGNTIKKIFGFKRRAVTTSHLGAITYTSNYLETYEERHKLPSGLDGLGCLPLIAASGSLVLSESSTSGRPTFSI